MKSSWVGPRLQWSELNDVFYSEFELQNKLRFIEKFHVDGENQRTYIYDLKEYPTRIKKLYIKGNSKKKVPIQMLNIQTNTIETNPEVYFNRYDVEFKEFTDVVTLPQIPLPREEQEEQSYVEQTAQIEEERVQAIAQVERAEERRARANRAEARARRANVRTGNVRDERFDEEEME